MMHIPPLTPERLSEIFLALLRQPATSTLLHGSAHRCSSLALDDQLELFLDAEGEAERPATKLRADDAAAAVLLARALAPLASTLNRLPRAPLIVMEASDPDAAASLARIVPRCLMPSGTRILREESVRSIDTTPGAPRQAILIVRGTPGRALDGEQLVDVLQSPVPVFVIAVDPDRTLPGALLRLCDVRVRVPGLDGPAMSVAIQAVTGSAVQEQLDGSVVERVTLSDLAGAVRPDRGTTEALQRLQRLLSSHRAAEPVPAFRELRGLGEVRPWGLGLIKDLKAWRDGILPWRAVAPGGLLTGPPGSGKGYAVAALAREAGARLILSSYGAWQARKDGTLGHLLIGLREPFLQARKHVSETGQPVILVIDEIDSLPARGCGSRHDSWFTPIVNELLVQLDTVAAADGSDQNAGIVVVGLCNDPTRIDPALARAGRLDRVLTMPSSPDLDDLAAILAHHLGADLQNADLTPAAAALLGSSAAEAARAVRDARQRARAADRPLTVADLLAVAGADRLPADILHRLAVHELGHALAALRTQPEAQITVVIGGTGGRGGSTELIAPVRPLTPSEGRRQLVRLLSGRAAEVTLLGSPSAGAGGDAASDLARATALAAAMNGAFGLVGPPIYLGAAGSPELARHPVLLGPVVETLQRAEREALALMRTFSWALRGLAPVLVERRRLTGQEILAWISAERARSPIPPEKRPRPLRRPRQVSSATAVRRTARS